MKYQPWLMFTTLICSSPAFGQDQIGEICTGTETVTIGANAPRSLAYSLTFSADLASGYYCYGECRSEQTFEIKDRVSDPIKLADFDGGSQTRKMTFSRSTGVLTDVQTMTILVTVTRRANALCRPGPYHQPNPLSDR